MNAAAKELPVSYDLSKPQEDREPYVGSVLFFKHVIFTVTLLLILIPTTLSIYLSAQVRSLNRQLDAAGSQLAAMQEQLPSTAPEGGEPTPAEPEPPAAEVPAYTELYPELYADDSLRGTVDVDNAVYLTFDDGPSARTDEILEILDKYGVKATFFVVGANEEGDLERMQKIVAAGHTLAIHSYSHDYKKIYASVEAYLEDFNQMFCQIYEATGVKPQIFRFPGGSVNSYNVGIHQQLIAEMTRRGFVYFDWNVANGDAVFSKIQPSSALTANALKGVGTARRAIILMHDSSAKTTTVEALPAIIAGRAGPWRAGRQPSFSHRSSSAAAMASSKEGCGRIARQNCSAVRWLASACAAPPIMSLTCSHMSCAPISSRVSAWATSFMKQRPGSAMTVLALLNMTCLPTLTGIPFSLASASVRPTTAISGRQ